ncbi:hypothetical protein G7Y89_g10020 [Cudoniella acicularis]|uniref:BTB domain-containing protein n=1 Tax=Cudoniella acicularis TaxID=354080 RepID=A0A8H4RDJ2_9HELO|nr:hypothetical protein G7Y89_g10020 [Cudoniella acicularis]
MTPQSAVAKTKPTVESRIQQTPFLDKLQSEMIDIYELPSVSFVNRAHKNLPKDSKLTTYALRSMYYVLVGMQDTLQDEIEKLWTTEEVYKLFTDHASFAFDYVLFSRTYDAVNTQLYANCDFHNHEKEELYPAIAPRSRIKSDIVTIHVGPDEIPFRLHKQFLCNRVPYFDKMFNGGFKEASDGIARMPEDDPGAFDVLAERIYQSNPYLTRPLVSHVDAEVLNLFCFTAKLSEPFHFSTELRQLFLRFIRYYGSKYYHCLLRSQTGTCGSTSSSPHQICGDEDLDSVVPMKFMNNITKIDRKVPWPSKEVAASNAPFSSHLQDDMVNIYVGSEEFLFRVHKKILCARIPYFDKMFNSGFKEGTELMAKLPEEEPVTFDLLVEWVYQSFPYPIRKLEAVRNSEGDLTPSWDVIAFYALAGRMCLPNLQDLIMDACIRYHKSVKELPSVEFAERAYLETGDDSRLSAYALSTIFYVIAHRDAYEFDNGWSTDAIHTLFQDVPQFSYDYINHARAAIQSKDPRDREACFYHKHSPHDPCPQEPSAGSKNGISLTSMTGAIRYSFEEIT